VGKNKSRSASNFVGKRGAWQGKLFKIANREKGQKMEVE
jgi:hypothetical protein